MKMKKSTMETVTTKPVSELKGKEASEHALFRAEQHAMQYCSRVEKLETESRVMYALAYLYRTVLQRCGPEGELLERELAALNELRTEYAATLTDDDYVGSDPTYLFENPLPMISTPPQDQDLRF
jgi:hypothetical protein